MRICQNAFVSFWTPRATPSKNEWTDIPRSRNHTRIFIDPPGDDRQWPEEEDARWWGLVFYINLRLLQEFPSAEVPLWKQYHLHHHQLLLEEHDLLLLLPEVMNIFKIINFSRSLTSWNLFIFIDSPVANGLCSEWECPPPIECPIPWITCSVMRIMRNPIMTSWSVDGIHP